MNILTITPNPAIDLTIKLDALVPGKVHRASSSRTSAGGKGVNVSSCLADWGIASRATGFLGQDNDTLFTRLFVDKGIEDRFLRLGGATRTNVKVVDADGTTDINLPGAPVTEVAISTLLERIEALAGPGLGIMSGSLPPGCPPSFYRRVISILAANGMRILLDTGGDALAAALKSDVPVQCIKPNRQELASLAGRELGSLDEIAEEAVALHRRGIMLVAVSLGREGALFVGNEGILLAKGGAEVFASTTGAGDAMVAGITAALAENADLERIARLSVAFSQGKLTLEGPNLPDRGTVEFLARNVTVERL